MGEVFAMQDYTDIKNEVEQLVELGLKICLALEPKTTSSKTACSDFSFFLQNYEAWYTKALLIVKQITPDRLQDFTLLYLNPKRKELIFSTYCAADALRNLTAKNPFDLTYKYGPWSARYCIHSQVRMVEACMEKFDSKIFDIQVILQADIFESELESAKHLLKMGFLRAAGAICGVVLEKHFRSVCKSRSIIIRKKTPTIADYNDALKDCAYDTVEWRRIQRLGDIRNLCDHSKDREPTKDEVEELISGTERVTKTVY